jgi:hypothetical protein
MNDNNMNVFSKKIFMFIVTRSLVPIVQALLTFDLDDAVY